MVEVTEGEERAAMAPIVNTLDIARPPDEVFAVATDPNRFPQWQADVVRVETDQPAPLPAQSSGYAVASMVLGILSILFCWLFGIVGLTMAILAIVFAGRTPLDQSGHRPGMAKAGRMTGIIGCTLSSLYLLAFVMAFNGRS